MTNQPCDIETYSRLLGTAYDAAADPAHWRTFLEGLADVLNAKSGLFRLLSGPVWKLAIGERATDHEAALDWFGHGRAST